jgi:hypothetical protein
MIMVMKATGKNLFNFRQPKPVNRINQLIESTSQSNQSINRINQSVEFHQ